jgi:hypothetical protein
VLESFTQETFVPLVGETFVVEAGGERMEVRLSEVNRLGAGDPAEGAPGRTPFSLLFLGPGDLVWQQKIYRVTNGSLGSFDLFLVPLGPEGTEMRYEAVFT